MIQLAKDKRRKRSKEKAELPVPPKPQWVEAFLILLLHKTGGQLKVPLKSLENFDKLTGENKTDLSYDAESQCVVLTAPKINIVAPDKRLII